MIAAALAALTLAVPFSAAELAPALSGRAAEAPAALADARWADALKLLDGHDQPEARLLRARGLSHLGRHEEAIRELAGLEGALAEIADRVLYLRGRELGALGRHVEAAAAWGRVAPGSVLADAAAVARGRALAAAKRTQEAVRALAPIGERPAPADLSREDPAAAALSALGSLLASSDPAAARGALLSCWVDHPLAPESEGCLDALRKLPGGHGSPPTVEQELARAERLLEANRNRAAIVLLEQIVGRIGEAGADAPLACRARSALGRGYRKERKHARAMEILRPVVARCSDPPLRLRALFVLAGSVAISGDREEALALYRRVAAEHADSSLADDALLSAADLLERLGRPTEALQTLAEATLTGAEGDRRPEALFRQAWGHRKAGALDEAAGRLRAIEEEFRGKDAYEHARAAYWRARIAAERGPEGQAEANALWEELVGRYPVDWYGLLSRARLAKARGEQGSALPEPLGVSVDASPAFEPGALRKDPHFLAAVRLLRIGLGSEAAEELNEIDLAPFRSSPDGAEPIFLVAALLDRAGDHRSAHAILKSDGRAVLRESPAGDQLRLWRIAYPEAFREEVVRFSEPSGVPPDLLQALMREESALDPQVVSRAGAVGLTQLMPTTAAAVAKRLGLGSISPTSLTDPAINIRIGAAYLGELLARFGGQPALALAAYNAGAGAVGRWLEARGGLELDEFVEEIPIDETRGYVKRVLRTFAAYRLLSAQKAPAPLDLLPRALRRGAHSEAISPAGARP